MLHDVLGRLYIAATRAGIDPKPYFADAAAVASPSASGGGTMLREILEGFDSSPYFREVVKLDPGAEWFRPASA